MKKYNVAILGATGAVGKEMLKILGERNFPINELKLLASKKSAGGEVEFKGKKYLNYLFPPQAEIEYEIERDSIYVKVENFKEEYFLYPDPKIRDRIVFPKFDIKIAKEIHKDDKIDIGYIDLTPKENKEITYIFE